MVYEYTSEDIELWLATAKDLVLQAGELIKDNLGIAANLKDKELNKGEGHSSEVLTETDIAVEKLLRDGLQKMFPEHRFIGEENEGVQGQITSFESNPTWIIDPIDGTMNFIHGNPLVCTSIGLAVNRKIVAGIVNCPAINHLYSAVKGKGAFLNDKTRLRSSGITKLKDAMVLGKYF